MDPTTRADALGDDPDLTQAHEAATKQGGDEVRAAGWLTALLMVVTRRHSPLPLGRSCCGNG